jgi:hypothetical protein
VDDMTSAIHHLTLTLRVMDDRLANLRKHAHTSWLAIGAEELGSGCVPRSTSVKRSRSLNCLPNMNSAPGLFATEADDAQLSFHEFDIHNAVGNQRISLDGYNLLEGRSDLPRIDDIVLYNAFSFAAHACLSAFLAIAKVILEDASALQSKIAKTSLTNKKER